MTNTHGVRGYEDSTGRWGHHERDPLDATGSSDVWRSHLPVFVPEVCTTCTHFDSGESGDYGEKLSPPYCMRNLFFPTRKGTCAVKDKGLSA